MVRGTAYRADQEQVAYIDRHKYKGTTHQVLICQGTGCASSGSEEVRAALKEEIKKASLSTKVPIVETGCFGFCRVGPIVVIYPEGTFYNHLSPEDVKDLVSEHLVKGHIAEKFLYKDTKTGNLFHRADQIDFFKNQLRVTLRNCGLINPMVIEEYIAREGYFALAKALAGLKPSDVINQITKSGLRGRGGGGFPTGRKWQFTHDAPGEDKYVVCNADEGDPGAFMDRSILEGNPHSVLEAMAIAGYTIGAKEGFIYIRAEYPIAVDRLQIAINQALDRGLLGKNILGSNFNFNIELRLGAGAFVCGEETALLRSIEGFRGEPKPRPPFPAVNGLWNRPTLVNNVETLANIPQIIIKGADWYAQMGTEKSKGTKVFAIAGKIANTGLIEVPMGTTLRTVVYDIGGGIPNGKRFKAAQTGGPSGGCIPESLLDIPIEYDTLLEAGSMMGSGGLIIMDEDDCMVDIAKFYLGFTRDESCGKCPPCRIGNKRLLEILEKITSGKATETDLELLEELSHQIKAASLCGLGQTSPNPVLSTLRYFREEYLAHVFEKRCPAGVCKELLSYRIIAEKCKTCGLCRKVCPVEAISGQPKKVHQIDPEKCIKCGACVPSCKFNAITR
ncbi:MAG: NADH-ubiquinone oxidoreductase-F iron-sulfur binding region domain-containing protein [Bacillota bacterium]